MGIFAKTEKTLNETGKTVGGFLAEFSGKVSGWGDKVDSWLDGLLDKAKEAVKKEETYSESSKSEEPTVRKEPVNTEKTEDSQNYII